MPSGTETKTNLTSVKLALGFYTIHYNVNASLDGVSESRLLQLPTAFLVYLNLQYSITKMYEYLVPLFVFPHILLQW